MTSRSLSGVSSRSQQKKEFPHDSLRRLATRARRALLSAAFALAAFTTLTHQQAAAQSATIDVWMDLVSGVDPNPNMNFPITAGGVQLDAANMSVLVHHKMESPNAGPPPVVHGWVNPPQSLASPAVNGSLPFGYRVKYILFDNIGDPGMPGPWSYTLTAGPLSTTEVNNYVPVSGWSSTLPLTFHDVSQFDDECTVPGGGCYHSYFNQQPVVLEGTTVKLRGNLQAEFR